MLTNALLVLLCLVNLLAVYNGEIFSSIDKLEDLALKHKFMVEELKELAKQVNDESVDR